MAASGTLLIKVLGDVGDFQKKMGSLGGELSKVGQNVAKAGQTMTAGVTLPILAVGGAVLKLASDAEETDARLSSAFESMGAASWTSLDRLQSKATELMSRTTFDDEAIKDAQAVLLTFGNVTGQAFDDGTLAALNLSSALGTDLQSATIMIGKALNDPVQGITAMTRAGIQFTDEQKNMIATMVEGGDTAGAQTIILAELERQFGGTAEKMATTTKGKMAQAFNELGNAGESIGKLLLPVLAELAGHVKNAAAAFESLSPETKGLIVQIAAVAAAIGPILLIGGKLLGFLGLLTKAVWFVNAALAANPIGLVVIAIAGLAAGVVLLLDHFGLLDDVIKIAVDAFDALMGVVSDLGYRLGGLIGVVSDVLGAIVDFGDAIIRVFQGDFEGAAQAAERGMARIGSAGVNMARVMGDSTQRAIDDAARLAEETARHANAVDESFEGMGGGVELAARTVGSATDSMATSTDAATGQMVGDLETLPPALDGVVGAFREAENKITKSLGDVTGAMGDMVGSSNDEWKAFKNTTNESSADIDKRIQKLQQRLQELDQEDLSKMGPSALANWAAARAATEEELGGLTSFVDRKSDIISTTLPNALKVSRIDAGKQWQAIYTLGTGSMADLEKAARTYGHGTIDAYAASIRRGQTAITRAVRHALSGAVGLLESASPPGPESPLHDIGRWGESTSMAWGDGFARSAAYVRDRVRETLDIGALPSIGKGIGALGGGLALSPATAAGGMGAVGPSIVEEHYHLNVYGLYGGPSGLSELEQAMYQLRRQKTRGGRGW